MSKATGGPAFPVLNDGHHMIVNMEEGQRLAEGMTLRDYFAARAMQGLMADPGCQSTSDEISAAAYRVADAMLAERAA